MTIFVRFLSVLLLLSQCGAAAAPDKPAPATGGSPVPFFVEAQWFRGEYELFMPALNLPSSAEADYAVKPWQLTAGRFLTPRLAVQVGYSYAHPDYRQSEAYVNNAGQTIRTTYHDEAILHCLPVLARYDLIPRSQAMHLDLLLGLTAIAAQEVASMETTINGQSAISQRLASRATHLYATSGAGFHYPFGQHLAILLNLTLNKNLRATTAAGGNVLGLTWASGLGLRYCFAVKKKAAAGF